MVEGLTFKALDPNDQAELDRVTQRPSGRADLPDPAKMTVAEMEALAPGALRLESEVSTYIVEPTLRNAGLGSEFTVQAEFPIGRRRADFVILEGDQPRCVVEVKLRAVAPGNSSSPDVKQAVSYAAKLGCPAILVDVSEFHLINSGEDHVTLSGNRTDLAGFIDQLRQHIING